MNETNERPLPGPVDRRQTTARRWSRRGLRVDPVAASQPTGLRSLWLSAVWFGLVAGYAELALVAARTWLVSAGTIGTMQLNRHYLWMIPAANLGLFAVAGVGLAIFGSLSGPRGVRAVHALLGFAALMALLGSIPGLHPAAKYILAAGFAFRLSGRIARHQARFSGLVARAVPLMLAALAGLYLLDHQLVTQAETRALAALPAAPSRGPNVLLLVLDTVRADHTTPYGYERETTPHLAALAARGVTFELARAPAPWTLPSHASLLTGRWPHELNVDKDHPLRPEFLTLAEHLSSRGYATAGFVANTYFCNAGFGLAQGFAHYEDYPERDQVSLYELLRNTALGQRVLAVSSRTLNTRAGVIGGRKTAAQINGDLLAWIDSQPRGTPQRPFFGFVNYMDAHDPYLPPPGFDRHFGAWPQTAEELADLQTWHLKDHDQLTPRTRELMVDGYDDCLAYLDEQLGALFTALEQRGLRQNTWIIVTSDHGEQFGEHGLYLHSNSLYRPVIDVPLIIAPPTGEALAAARVSRPVSLRDIPATVADLTGSPTQTGLPGTSLRRLWTDPGAALSDGGDPVLSEVDLAGARKRRKPGRTPASRGPMQALIADGQTYIHLGDGSEELYDLATDPGEQQNRVNEPGGKGQREAFRASLRKAVPADLIQP